VEHSPLHRSLPIAVEKIQQCENLFCQRAQRLLANFLFGFAVGTVAAAEAAVFAELQPVRRFLLIFLGVVITALALRASHNNHYTILFFCHLQSIMNMK
jgi:sulfite exporter TauE/SafE